MTTPNDEFADGVTAVATVDLTQPHWRCVCGAVAMPLTDDTRCQCKDEYDNAWTRVDPTRGVGIPDGSQP